MRLGLFKIPVAVFKFNCYTLKLFRARLTIMAEPKDEEVLGDVDQEKAAKPLDLEQKDDDLSLEKVPPASSPSAIVDGGIKGWIIAFGGFCCL